MQPTTTGAGDTEHRRRELLVGIGVSSQANAESVIAAVDGALRRVRADGPHAALAGIVTWDRKAAHPVLLAVAAHLGVRVLTVETDDLRAHDARAHTRVARLTSQDGLPGPGSVASAAVRALGGRPVEETRAAPGAVIVVGVREDAARAFDPLRHHGDVEARAARIDLAVNVVARTPPAWLVDALHGALDGAAAYPDAAPARAALARRLGVPTGRVLLVNGAAEAFTLVAQLRRWRRPLVVHPQFTEPDAALRAAGHEVAHHVLAASEGFVLRPERVDPQADLVVVGNPTNPTSRLHSPSALRTVRDSGPPDRLLVVDEAFMDVVPGESATLLGELRSGPGESGSDDPECVDGRARGGLAVVRSLTKTFGLAGIRAGYVVAHETTIERLEQLQPPWSVNAVALAAICACLGPEADDHVGRVVRQIARDRAYLAARLRDCGLQVVPGAAGPFLLLRHPSATALREALRRDGIAVRRGDTFPGLGPEWLRVAVRDVDTTDALVESIAKLSDPERLSGSHEQMNAPPFDPPWETP